MSRSFRLVAPVAPEDDLHECVARALALMVLPPAMWSTFPSGHIKLPPAAAAKLQRAGLKRGIPDILVWHAGACFGLELKRVGAALSRTRSIRTRKGTLRIVEGQIDTFPKLQAAGMKIGVARSVDEALAQLTAWGVPLRGYA